MSNSYTMTKQELVDLVKAHVTGLLEDSLQDYLSGAIDESFFSQWHNIDKVLTAVNPLCSEIDSITHFWCDCMADDFFTSHPDIDDVLLLIDFTPAYILDTGEKSPAIPIKMWLASK